MQKTLTLLIIILTSSIIYSQQQMNNPGFEEWEEIGFGPDIIEPIHWSSIKSSDDPILNGMAPVVLERSEDAHSGNYSIKLTNIATLGIVATGTTSNGRFHPNLNPDLAYVYTDIEDDRWHTAITDKPDSLTGWYKCNPEVNDFATVKFILHKGADSIPSNEMNHIAIAYIELPSNNIDVWTRFSTPFVYSSDDNPQYILSVITSGNGTEAISGSTAHFDDIELIYNGSSVDELTINKLDVYQEYNNLIIGFPANVSNELNVEIRNISGQKLISTSINRSSSNHIDVGSLKSGLYLVTAANENSMYLCKVMIIK